MSYLSASRTLLAFGLVSSLAAMPPAARAGGGRLTAPTGNSGSGAMELNINFRFPPSQAQVDRVKEDLRMASRVLCDASEGQVRIKQVKLTAGAAAEDEADAWIIDDSESPRSFVPGMPVRDAAGNNVTGFTQGPGTHITFFYSNTSGGVWAHELMHYAFRISDEYRETRRDGSPCGHGAGMDMPGVTEPFEDGVAPLASEIQHSLAQANPPTFCESQNASTGVWTVATPCASASDCDPNQRCAASRCQFQDMSTGVWNDVVTTCQKDSDCSTGQRCFLSLASEFTMSEQYFDLEEGTGDLTDCPPPRATTVVYPARSAGALLTLGDATPINTDDFTKIKTYEDARAAAAMVTEVEVIDDVGIFTKRYDRSSHKLMLYYQKVAADQWRVSVGFDANKMPGGDPDKDPELTILGSFDIDIQRGAQGCGDGIVQSNLNEECEPAAGGTRTCSSLAFGSTVISSNTVTCDPATCTWDRTPCSFANSGFLNLESCGDGTVQTNGFFFPSNRNEQCEPSLGSSQTCADGSTYDCTNCLNDPGGCPHSPSTLTSIVVNNGNPITLTIPLGAHAHNSPNSPDMACMADMDCTPGDVCRDNVCNKVVFPSALNLTIEPDRDGDGNVDFQVGTGGSASNADIWAPYAHQLNGFGDCGEAWGDLTCARYWKTTAGGDAWTGDFVSTRQRVDIQEFDWQTLLRIYPWMGSLGSVAIGGSNRPIVDDPSCFGNEDVPGDVNFVSFDEQLTPAEQVYVVLDVSGSMDTEDGNDGKKRIEDAKAAAEIYLQTQASEATLDVGLIKFATTAECFAPGSDACGLGVVNGSTVVALRTEIDALTTGGTTAIGDALDLARTQFAANGDPAKSKTIYLLSDGHHNAGTLSPEQALAQLPADIRVVTVGLGEANREQLGDISRQTGGYSLNAERSDELGTLFHEISARSRGHSLALPSTELEVGGVLQASNSVDFEISPGSTDLSVVVTARDQKSWQPNLILAAPDGTVYTETSPEVTKRPNAFVLIQIPTPAAGTWSLTTTGTPLAQTQRSYASVSVNDPPARCYVSASPGVVQDGETLVITPTVIYGGDLDPSTVSVGGKLLGPGGFELPLTFARGSGYEALTTAEVPVASLNGRGAYTVQMTCQATDASRVISGDTITGDSDYAVNVVPFEYAATTTFFYDTGVQPDCGTSSDCDGDGVPNGSEPAGDADGDGYDNRNDPDSDNDDAHDADDNCPLAFNPEQVDSDGDGAGDACDSVPSCGADPNDCDGDGIPNASEPPGDADGDGFPNDRDNDSDNDNVGDGVDNCPLVANPDQNDSDGDGDGDACDSVPLDIIVGEGTNVTLSPVGNASLVTFFAGQTIDLGLATVSVTHMLSEGGQELVAGVPVTIPPGFGSTPFEGHYLSLPTVVEIVWIPFVGHMAVINVAPTQVQAPQACLAGATTVPLTTTLVIDDGTGSPVVTSVTENWRCLAGGGIEVAL